MPHDPLTLRHTNFPLLAVLLVALTLVGCESQADKAHRERYAKAEAVFKERCKTAGVVIKRTVEDVEGIELTKLRADVPLGGKEYFDPMWAEAAMAGEYRGHDYINQFLMTESIDWRAPEQRGSLNPPDFDTGSRYPLKRGYRYVEITGAGGARFRAEFEKHPPGTNLWGEALKLTPVATSTTRYALDFDDIVDPEDRKLWIAGTVVKVVDKETGEVIAQLTRFVWDPGFGVSTTGRWPWQHAATGAICPFAEAVGASASRKFVDTVLIPKQGD
jgi:hypothetical protein